MTALLAALLLLAPGDVDVTVDAIGIGNSWRPGDVTAMHVTVTSALPAPQAAWIQWEVPDADGDIVEYGRPITLAPGRATATWLWAPTRTTDDHQTIWILRVRSFGDGVGGEDLAIQPVEPATISTNLIDGSEGLIAVLGTRRMGLDAFQPSGVVLTQGEASRIVSGLDAEDIPDLWPALGPLQALIWADAPPELDRRQASALLTWVRHGGHLVIILPGIANPWEVGSEEGPLREVLVGLAATPGTATLGDVRGLLGRSGRVPAIPVSMHVLSPAVGDWGGDLQPILTMADGRVVAAERRWGYGAVTIVGIDLADGRLASLGLPEADIFWNRILGRRADTPSPTAMAEADAEHYLNADAPRTITLRGGHMAAAIVAMSAAASGRVALVLLVLIAYWLIAGPVGFLLLKRRRLSHWSWAWFVASAAIFAAGTWGLAAFTTSTRQPLRHVTVLDHIYGAETQRIFGWFSAFLPGYGTRTISAGGVEDDVLLLPWTPPGGTSAPFADTRRLVVAIDQPPSSITMPSRATTATFTFDALGGVDQDRAGDLIRIDPADPPAVRESGGTWRGLTGALLNRLPAALQDVSILWVTNGALQRPRLFVDDGKRKSWVRRDESGRTLNRAYMWRMARWEPDDRLHLGLLDTSEQGASLEVALANRYVPRNNWDRYDDRPVPDGEWRRRMEMLAFYGHLPPPTWLKAPDDPQATPSGRVLRVDGRTMDLARWFGRPCIIVTGFVPDAEIPLPITVDDREPVASTGTVMVRWIYPLDTIATP